MVKLVIWEMQLRDAAFSTRIINNFFSIDFHFGHECNAGFLGISEMDKRELNHFFFVKFFVFNSIDREKNVQLSRICANIVLFFSPYFCYLHIHRIVMMANVTAVAVAAHSTQLDLISNLYWILLRARGIYAVFRWRPNCQTSEDERNFVLFYSSVSVRR